MTVSPSFPPVDALLDHVRKIDYIKWLNVYMDTVEQICLIIAAFVVVCARKWREHKVTERLRIVTVVCIIGLAVVFDFLKETVWPIVNQTTQNVWRICYTSARPPLTV